MAHLKFGALFTARRKHAKLTMPYDNRKKSVWKIAKVLSYKRGGEKETLLRMGDSMKVYTCHLQHMKCNSSNEQTGKCETCPHGHGVRHMCSKTYVTRYNSFR